MEVYETEREQIDAIKRWWKQNGKAVVIGAILGLGSLIGWQQWQAHVKQARERASAEYEVMLSNMESNNIADVKERGAHILNEYSGTPYATLSALMLAKVYANENDFAPAKTYLQVVINQDKQPQLQQVARLRMARLLLAEGNAQQALTLVQAVNGEGFTMMTNELEGDIQVALGNRDAARAAYQRALDAFGVGLDSAALQMKLDDVGGPEVNS